MPIIEVEDVKCPACGDVADVDIDDAITEPQDFECDECGQPFQVTWDPTAKTATVEEIWDEEDEELLAEAGRDLPEDDDEDFK